MPKGCPCALSNRGEALVAGRRVPIVGRICMNMAFVDVTGVAEARPGARGHPCSAATATSDRGLTPWPNAPETIGYEVVARLPADVPRRYVESAVPA